MECNCRGWDDKTNVREHKVIRNWDIVGTYLRCGICMRIEWLTFSDGLEIELKDKGIKMFMSYSKVNGTVNEKRYAF